MRAVVINRHGDIDCLEVVDDLPQPKCAAGEVIVQIRSAALNHLDIWVRKGRPGHELSAPHVLGSDAAGIVIEKGVDTRGVNVGDEVIINPGLSCGYCEQCRAGQQSQCASFGLVGMSRPGTFAQKIAVPFANVWPKPQHLDFSEAATLALAHQTAWRMLMTRGRLKPGETLLIHGIGGGVARACLQLAKLAGATVIVTSGSDEKIEKAKLLGADCGINYKSTPDVAATVKDLTDGRGVDIIADTVGAATWPLDFEAVKRAGRIVICGVTGGPAAETNLQALYWNQLTILGSTMGSDEDFRQMFKAVTAARVKPVVDSVYPLEQAAAAMTRMERGKQFGKIVLDI
jgi:NADPH:quinone reductase-like Zn-dependent oxidoreductase